MVPEAAAGRHQGGAADGQAAGVRPVRDRAAAARARGGGDARPTTLSSRRGRRRPCGPRRPPRVRRHGAADRGRGGLLALRRRELLRTATADLLGMSGLEETGEALTAVAAVTVGGRPGRGHRRGRAGRRPAADPALRGRHGQVRRARDGLRQRRRRDVRARAAARRRRGGRDAGRARGRRGTARAAGPPGPDPALPIDAGLRPEGRQGPLVRTLASYRAYYQRWSAPWEAQALLRAEPVAGDAALGAAFTAMADEIRYPARRDGRGRPSGRSAGSRPGWRPNACPAASIPRCTSSSARAG